MRTRFLQITTSMAMTLSFASPAAAVDGGEIGGAATYYEGQVATATAEQLDSTALGYPTQLTVSPSTATLRYTAEPLEGGSTVRWTASVRGFTRSHERIDAVYHMLLLLPLPADVAGRDDFVPEEFGIRPRSGDAEQSVPLVYGGEPIVLKRATAFEKTLLPRLISALPEPGRLPEIAGSGYRYTIWDTIVRYDPSYGEGVSFLADFEYVTNPEVSAPDASDESLKAYVITWIPSFDPAIAPFAIEIDVVDPD